MPTLVSTLPSACTVASTTVAASAIELGEETGCISGLNTDKGRPFRACCDSNDATETERTEGRTEAGAIDADGTEGETEGVEADRIPDGMNADENADKDDPAPADESDEVVDDATIAVFGDIVAVVAIVDDDDVADGRLFVPTSDDAFTVSCTVKGEAPECSLNLEIDFESKTD
jgi:hypothetical protein